MPLGVQYIRFNIICNTKFLVEDTQNKVIDHSAMSAHRAVFESVSDSAFSVIGHSSGSHDFTDDKVPNSGARASFSLRFFGGDGHAAR